MDKEKLLHKFLNGEASEAEITVLREDPEYGDLLHVADAVSEFETPAFKADTLFENIKQQTAVEQPVRSINGWKPILRVAAIVAVIALGYFYITGLQTNVTTGIAQTMSFELPDNSTVELNANSEVSYKKRGWDNNRKLQLNGEAYFKVSKGNRFDVETEQGVVSVLGTQFNVYSRDTIFNVKCFEGLVSVKFADTLLRLPAGNKLKIENGKLVVHTPTNITKPSWIDRESSFENASLATVLMELENQYPVEVNSPQEILNKRFTGSFSHDDLSIALQSICDPLRLKYTIEGETITIYSE